MTSPRPRPSPRPGPRPVTQAPAAAPAPAAEPATTKPAKAKDTDRRIVAVLPIVLAVAAIWVVQIVNAHDHYGFDRFGLRPRDVGGLWGVLTLPFLQSSWHELLADTVPVLAIGWVVMLTGLRTWAVVTATIIVLGGALSWATGPTAAVGHEFVGVSGLLFGWLGYVIARAVVSRRIMSIVIAILVLVVFGTLLVGLFPSLHSALPWQVNVCQFAAGAVAGALLHRRDRRRRREARSARRTERAAVS